MLRTLISIFILIKISFACGLCQLQVPVVGVSLELRENNSSIHWLFSKEFSKEIVASFDTNGDNHLGKAELIKVKESLTDYLKSNGYLTNIYHYPIQNQPTPLEFNVTDDNFDLSNDYFKYRYKITHETISNRGIVQIEFKDDKKFFDFTIQDANIDIEGKDVSKNIFINQIFLNFKPKLDENQTIKPKVQNEKNSNFYTFLEENLKHIVDKIKFYLNDIKENGSLISTLSLMLFSLIYGILHALGPGHGKSLVASYFLSHNKSYMRAFSIASLIAIVHTFSAFILTFVMFFILNNLLSNFLNDATLYISKTSAVVIISIALYLLYKKIKPKKVIKSWSNQQNKTILLKPQNLHNNSCGCSACNTKSTDLGIILSAGIVPCPGTVAIFILTISINLYLVGFLSALTMSFGMSFIIFISAILSIKVKKTMNNKNSNLAKKLEYFSLIFILILGILLLFS